MTGRRARAARARAAAPSITATVRLEFGRRLRAWYRRNARDLPWRRTDDPYHILVSELMLQQTQVVRVVPKYGEFLGQFPTLESVAAASPTQVMEAWTGLGYYARAHNLHRLARTLTTAAPRADSTTDAPARGPATLPSDPLALRALPGIGAYTAGAVASFGYHRAAALVDTNVARVLTRAFAPRLDPRSSRGRRAAWAIAEATLPRSGSVASTQNQALMELGALVCTARVAHCAQCPVQRVCRTASGRPAGGGAMVPKRTPTRRPTVQRLRVAVSQRAGSYRPPTPPVSTRV